MKAKKIKKEIQKAVHKEWRDFYDSIFGFSFHDRFRLARALITYHRPKSSTDNVWNQRRRLEVR